VIGWYYPDEPDLKGIMGETLPGFPPLEATGRLRVLTLSNHFYSRTADLPAGRGVYPGLVAASDVVGFDLYPLQESCDAGWLPDVAAAQRELAGLAGDRPTFQWIEARSWHCRARGLSVTPATIRVESWLAVAGGARGLGFFPADWPFGVAQGIAGVAKEVAALQPVLLAPEEPVSVSAPIVAAARSFGSAFYVIAVNPTRRALTRRSTQPASPATPPRFSASRAASSSPKARSPTGSDRSPSTCTSSSRGEGRRERSRSLINA
jgi:hypothetical protein